MKQWNYLQFSILIRDYDKASGFLWDLGTQGIEEHHLKSSRVRIKAYFDPASDILSIEKGFKASCGLANIPLFSISLKIQKEKDWLKRWRSQLNPFPVGKRFYLFPSANRTGSAPGGRIPLWIEPSMAFGTGTHETTQLCLEAIEEYLWPKTSLLDVGTGSGILAIAATKLGARKVVACDTDPVAIRIARANAEINRCPSPIEWVLGDIGKTGSCHFDFLVANLTADIIEESIPQFEKQLRSRGVLVLSGILSSQSVHIRSLLPGTLLGTQRRKKKGEWDCLVLRKS
jgi:ribosomal protein L11 methyltransferase